MCDTRIKQIRGMLLFNVGTSQLELSGAGSTSPTRLATVL